MLFYGIWGDFFLFLFSALVNSGILALYGYLPSKYYLKGRRLSRLIAGFVIMLLLDLGLSIFVEFVWIYRYDTYYLSFLPYLIQYYLLPTAFSVLIFGGISIGLCSRRLTSSMLPRSQQSASSPAINLSQKVTRCTKCGYDNPPSFEFCGKCGSPLREEETRIY